MNRFFFVALYTAIATTHRHFYSYLLTSQVVQRDGIAWSNFVFAEHSRKVHSPGNTFFAVAIAQFHEEAFALLLVEKVGRRPEINDHTLAGINRSWIGCGRYWGCRRTFTGGAHLLTGRFI